MSHEEESYTHPEVIAKIREKLAEYFKTVAEATERIDSTGFAGSEIGRLGEHTSGFSKIGVVDGGSNILSLNVGYIGVVTSVGIVIEENRVVARFAADPQIVPSNPRELPEYESPSVIESIIDKTREALVFENALRILREGVDLLVVDGPLIPYGALAKRLMESSSEEEAWRRYRRAVIELHRASINRDVNLVGFVKRPRSRYIASLRGLNGFDHVILSQLLQPGEYYPEPPLELSGLKTVFHEKEVAELVEAIKPRAVYLRLTESTPPYRVDIGHTIRSHRDILSYLYSTRTRDGVPFIIMKADEEAKITRRLIKELYEDILHDYIFTYVASDPRLLSPLLPEYGGV